LIIEIVDRLSIDWRSSIVDSSIEDYRLPTDDSRAADRYSQSVID